MSRTIQQTIHAAMPYEGDGITMAELYVQFRIHKSSVQNAIARLRAMGLVIRVSRRPSRYLRASSAPCPNDRRGRPTACRLR